MRPRLGHIQFLNCLPLYYGLVKNDVLLDVELIKGVPRDLTTGLLSGKLDIAPIPAIDYCRYHKSLFLLPNLSVSSDGEVKSILLVSNLPLDELNCKIVALTNTSATSQALAKILLHYKYQVTPIYIEYPPDLPQMMREADAALLIGDDALRALYQPSPLLKYDLGSEWLDFCGRKMVYAVWAVHREFAITKPELVKEVYRALYKSLEYSKENVDQIAEYAARWEIFSVGFLKSYFTALHFDFSLSYQEGLLFFFQRAQELGLVNEVAPLNFTGEAL